MPKLPASPLIPKSPPNDSIMGVIQWISGFLSSFQRSWEQMAYVVNGFSSVGNLADLPPNPQIDEVFFTTIDSKQTFVAIDGQWLATGPRRGSGIISDGATSVVVVLNPNEPNMQYHILATPSFDAGGIWITNRLNGSFTINTANAATTGGGQVDWLLLHT